MLASSECSSALLFLFLAPLFLAPIMSDDHSEKPSPTLFPANLVSPCSVEVNSSEENPYGYIPTRYICILYLVLFGFSAGTYLGLIFCYEPSSFNLLKVAHLKQSIYFRIWWLLPTACLCGVLEVAAWSARLSSSFHPFSRGPYEIQ